jgi:nicotinate-nucleotide adenylyltransferase
MKVGVFGGAFDPPHNGHVALVKGALETLGLGRVLVVPAADPPHKMVATSASVRAGLTELAFAGISRVELSPVELEPGGPRYTVDTLRLLRGSYADLTLLVGSDQFAAFPTWRDPNEILELAQLGVASRPGQDESEFRPVLAGLTHPERVVFFAIPPYPVSSREIRSRVRKGLPIEDLVPRAVAEEIGRLGLYRE